VTEKIPTGGSSRSSGSGSGSSSNAVLTVKIIVN
jgi:hypothetical protein